MKMWNISVEPMPSSSSMPVASRQCLKVAAGSGSAAETPRRSAPRSKRFLISGTSSIRRYDVGAEADRHALPREGLEHRLRREPSREHRGGAEAEREDE